MSDNVFLNEEAVLAIVMRVVGKHVTVPSPRITENTGLCSDLKLVDKLDAIAAELVGELKHFGLELEFQREDLYSTPRIIARAICKAAGIPVAPEEEE